MCLFRKFLAQKNFLKTQAASWSCMTHILINALNNQFVAWIWTVCQIQCQQAMKQRCGIFRRQGLKNDWTRKYQKLWQKICAFSRSISPKSSGFCIFCCISFPRQRTIPKKNFNQGLLRRKSRQKKFRAMILAEKSKVKKYNFEKKLLLFAVFEH